MAGGGGGFDRLGADSRLAFGSGARGRLGAVSHFAFGLESLSMTWHPGEPQNTCHVCM